MTTCTLTKNASCRTIHLTFFSEKLFTSQVVDNVLIVLDDLDGLENIENYEL